MSVRASDQRAAVAALLECVELESVTTVSVAGKRCVESLPSEVAIRLEHQPAHAEQRPGSVLIHYGHRATFFPETEVPPGPDEAPTVSDDAMLGRVEAAHTLTLRCTASSPLDDATLQAFAEADGYFMTYPYVRATLQHLAEQVSLPPVVLPFLTRSITKPR